MNTNQINQIRQGDVLLVRVKETPKGAKECVDNAVAEGELHNHYHRIRSKNPGDVMVMEHNDNFFVSVKNCGTIEHVIGNTEVKADHDIIEIPEGKWKVVIQRQYNPFQKTIDKVRD